ncbi:MAG: tRNA (guanosine(37)-N1)-methyltransferase TrmD, partial [Miltoncostaeaceae bacterium]
HRRIALTPDGAPLTQAIVEEFVAPAEVGAEPLPVLLLCGRYEGFDERVHDHLANDCISLGPFVLAGGEVAAMAMIDALARRLPGALGNAQSLDRESFSPGLDGRVEHPHYTRPAEFRGWGVPQVLLSGDHGAIEEWRRSQVGDAPAPGTMLSSPPLSSQEDTPA